MQHLSDWSSTDGTILLHLSAKVIEVFAVNVQSSNRSESGGILLGTVHEKGLMIETATQPSRMDRQFRYMFERMPFGHSAIARRHWRLSNGTVRYLGEWHTHPQDVPSPSGIDLSEWQKLAQVRLDKRPTLSVIVGRKTLHIEMMDRNGNRVILAPAT
jgi:integrative and conjugative element protein (TIGR02256 family)